MVWSLYLRQDGKGNFGYGSHAPDSVPVWPGTIDYDALWRTLSNSNVWSETRTSVGFSFYYADSNKQFGKHLKDLSLWTNLVEQAMGVMGEDHHLRKLMKTYPIDGSEPAALAPSAVSGPSANELLLKEIKEAGLGGNLLERTIGALETNEVDRFTDDLALILLERIRNLTWGETDAAMRIYRACGRHASLRCSLEDGTRSGWKQELARLKEIGADMAGGDDYIWFVARVNLLGMIQKQAQRAKRRVNAGETTGTEAMEAFVREEAKRLLENYREPPIKTLLKQMAEGKSVDME